MANAAGHLLRGETKRQLALAKGTVVRHAGLTTGLAWPGARTRGAQRRARRQSRGGSCCGRTRFSAVPRARQRALRWQGYSIYSAVQADGYRLSVCLSARCGRGGRSWRGVSGVTQVAAAGRETGGRRRAWRGVLSTRCDGDRTVGGMVREGYFWCGTSGGSDRGFSGKV